MEHPSHTCSHTERGIKNIKRREKRNAALKHNEYTAAQMRFVKKVRTRKRRHFDKMEVPSI